jgi:TonB family protein
MFNQLRLAFIAFILAQSLPLTLRSQVITEPAGAQLSPPFAYNDSTEGLRLLLTDALDTVKTGDSDKLTIILKDMEMPNNAMWFFKAFGPSGTSGGIPWAITYRVNMRENQKAMRELFVKLAKQDGEFYTRQVNAAPDNSFESGLLDSMKQSPDARAGLSTDIFFAAWKTSNISSGSNEDPIGYFMYVDGKFRWDSTITLVKTQGVGSSGNAESAYQVVRETPNNPIPTSRQGSDIPPRCIVCPEPKYTKEAIDAKVQGYVILQITVPLDGQPENIQIIKRLGYGLDEAAVEAVRRWTFEPAIGRDGAPVTNTTPVEVNFRLLDPRRLP